VVPNLKGNSKGPAPKAANTEDEDIVDETLNLFRANMFFRNFEIKGNGDRLLLYLILYTSQALGKLVTQKTKVEAEKALQTLAVESFPIPGDKGFALAPLVGTVATRQDQDLLRQYFTQLRQELGMRLVARVYADGKTQSKWWTCFTKRKFMNKFL